MALDKKLFKPVEAAAAAPSGTGNQEDGLMMYLDANDVDSYDGDGSYWYDIANHEYTPAENPAEHFKTVTYSGTGATNAITGLGFQPDLVWIKRRNSAVSHYHFNSVVGDGKYFYTDANNAAITSSESNLFNSDGFTLANSVLGNNSSGTYVAWCLKAGGAPTASNPIFVDGTGYATLSAAGLSDSTNTNYTSLKLSVNTDLGFSIVRATAPINPATSRLPHGLGQEPEMVIHKALGMSYDWGVWHKDLSSKNHRLRLNQSAASDSFSNQNGGYWTAVNSTDVMYLQDSSSRDQMYYSFVSKRGVSKVASYTGSTGSVKVYTGFEPAFVMIKNTSSTDPWVIFDNQRGDNGEYDYLYPSENYSEGAGDSTLNSGRTGITFNADGFTLDDDDSHSVNENGKTFIYLAFAAEKPSSLIDDTDLVLHLDAGDDDSYSGSGSTWSDLANSNDATISGASWDRELGNWFDFDGTNDELTFSSSTALTTRTIEFWYYSGDLLNNMWVFDSMPQTGSANSFGVWSVYVHTDYIYFIGAKWNGSTYGGYAGSNTMKEDTWHHIAFSCENGSYKGYVDGELISDTNSQYYVTTRNVDSVTLSNVNFMGMRSGYTAGTHYAEGKLGQIRIYDTVLSQEQIRQNYRFTKNDYPNGLNGTFNGLTSSDWNSNGYFNFPTGSDRIDLDFKGIDFNQTLVMWVNLGNNTNIDSNSRYRYYLYSQYTGSNYQYFNIAIYDYTTGGYKLNILWRDSSTSYYFLEDSIDSDFGSGWNMVAVYVGGTEEAYYSINGNDWTEATVGYGDLGNEDVIPKGNVLLSGYRGNTSITTQANPFSMSQLKVYDKVLTSSELSSLNTAGYQG